MPLEIRGAHFLIRSAQLVRGTRLEQALHQLVKFDFTADLTGTGNRSEEVIK